MGMKNVLTLMNVGLDSIIAIRTLSVPTHMEASVSLKHYFHYIQTVFIKKLLLISLRMQKRLHWRWKTKM